MRLGGSGPGPPCRVIPTDLCGAVDVLDGEDVSQAIQQNLGQRWDQLGRGHQHVHALPSAEQKNNVSGNGKTGTGSGSSGSGSDLDWMSSRDLRAVVSHESVTFSISDCSRSSSSLFMGFRRPAARRQHRVQILVPGPGSQTSLK